jgi:HEAT repeat protein
MSRRIVLPAALIALALSASHPAAAQDTVPPAELATLPMDSLLVRMTTPDREVARDAFDEAVRRNRPHEVAPYLLRGDGRTQSAALGIALELGDAGVPVIVAAVRTGDPASRGILSSLRYTARGEARFLPLAAALLAEADPEVRAAGASILERPWYADEDTVPSAENERLMLAALADPAGEVRSAAVNALSMPRYVCASEIDALVRILRSDPDTDVRAEAALTLGSMRSAARSAVPHLVAAMTEDTDATVRWRAATALGEMGPAAAEAVPELMRAARSEEKDLRTAAVVALGWIGIGPPVDAGAVLRTLRDALSHPDSITRDVAVDAAAMLGAPARPLLVEALRDPAARVAVSAAAALGDGAPVPASADALFAALGDPRQAVREAAADALASLGPEQLPRLRATAVSGDADERAAAARAVNHLEAAMRLRLAGACYAVRRGPWTPGTELGGDSVFSNPPQQVRFTTRVRTRAGRPEPSFDLDRADPDEHGWTLGTWQPVAERDSVVADFTNGHSGVVMRLEVRPDGSLEGTARTYWDFPRDSQTAEVAASPIPCPAGPEERAAAIGAARAGGREEEDGRRR